MIKTNKKGFTLIELMVVIAIIAILATVVLVSLQSARDRATDTNKIAATTQIRSLAEVYFSKDLDYSGITDPAEELSEIFNTYCDDESCGEVGEYDGSGELVIHIEDDDSGYCAEIALEDGEFFCVDGPGLKSQRNETAKCTAASVNCN